MGLRQVWATVAVFILLFTFLQTPSNGFRLYEADFWCQPRNPHLAVLGVPLGTSRLYGGSLDWIGSRDLGVLPLMSSLGMLGAEFHGGLSLCLLNSGRSVQPPLALGLSAVWPEELWGEAQLTASYMTLVSPFLSLGLRTQDTGHSSASNSRKERTSAR